MRRLLAAALVGVALAAPAARAQTANPLEKAKEGQWVLQKSTAAGMTNHMYQWVSKVDGKKITIRTQLLNADGKTGMMAASEATIDLGQTASGGTAQPGASPKITDDEIELKGKKVKCKKIEVASGPIVATSWISEDVPVSGLVKSVSTQDGKEVGSLETVDFGQTGGADKPTGGAAGGEGGGAQPGMGGGAAGGEGAGAGEAKPAAADFAVAVGDEVGAKWVNKADKKEYWFAAKVLSITGDKYAVEYGDGDLAKLVKADLRPACKAADLKAGDRIIAQWNDKPQLYPGAVDSISGKDVIVKWDDGSKPSVATGAKVFKE